MRKIFTIVGARPQFIKAAVLSRLLKSSDYNQKFQEFIVHTGQHYDANMSEIFFSEMGIPAPHVNLGVGGKNHGAMTGEMLIKLEELLLSEKPDIVLVYGDTDSTLAGALAASKLHIPVAHVEAGLRSFNMDMPEEQNRICTDHLATWLFCPTQTAMDNLARENLAAKSRLVGDIMYDAHLYYRQEAVKLPRQIKNDYILATIHRAENTDNPEILQGIFNALESCRQQFVLPLHPRTRIKCQQYRIDFPKNIQIINPVGYLEMLSLQLHSQAIITDSGGVQKEAYFCQKPCLTIREQTEWVETVASGWNTLVGTNPEKIIAACRNISTPASYQQLYGNGKCGQQILELLN